MNLLQEFNNREKALIVWFLFFWILALSRKEVRVSFYGVLKALVNKYILATLAAMVLYTSIEIFSLCKIGLWQTTLTKDTVFWILGTAFVLLLNINTASKDERFFRKILLDNVKFVLVFEFLVNFYTFPLLCETILIPFIFVFAGMAAIADRKVEDKSTKKLVDFSLGVFGIFILVFSFVKMLSDFQGFATSENLRTFILPPLLTVGYMPFMYLVALFMAYEDFFILLDLRVGKRDAMLAKFTKWQILRLCHVNLGKFIRMSQESRQELMRARDKTEVKSIIRKYEGRIITMNRQSIMNLILSIFMLVVVLLVSIYVAVQEPPFKHVMEVVRAIGELYLWPMVILVLVGWVFREPIIRLIDRMRRFSTPLGPVDLSPHELIAIPTKSTLEIRFPGNIYWLAHNLEHTRLRLELMWPKGEVIAMLDRCIHHANTAQVPQEQIERLEEVRKQILDGSPDTVRWHQHAEELEVISRSIAGVAEYSHPDGYGYVPAP